MTTTSELKGGAAQPRPNIKMERTSQIRKAKASGFRKPACRRSKVEWLVVVVSQVMIRNDSLSDQLNTIDQEMSHE